MTPAQRALSVGLDLVSVSPIPGKIFRLLKNAHKITGLGAVDDAVKLAVKTNRRDLKVLTNKTVVKSYDDMVKAGNRYTDNLAEIEYRNDLIKNRFGGALNEDRVALEIAEKATKDLKLNVINTGNKLSQNIRASGIIKNTKAIAGDLPGFADDYGRQYADDLGNIVKNIYNKPADVGSLTKRINKFKNELKMAQFDKNESKLAKLLSEVPEINAEAKQVYAARAQQLTRNVYTNAEDIANMQKQLKGKLTIFQRTKLEKQLALAKKKAPRLKTAADKAYKFLDVEVAEDVQRSSGRGGLATTTKPSKVGPKTTFLAGGGVKRGTKRIILVPLIGTKPVEIDLSIFPDVTPGAVPRPEKTPEPKPGTPSKPGPQPGRGPSPEPGAEDDPKASPKPDPRPDPKPDPDPGPKPGRGPGPDPGPEPGPTPEPEPKPSRPNITATKAASIIPE